MRARSAAPPIRAATAGWPSRTEIPGWSAVEHRPADLVAQALVVEDQFANRRRELVALPAALCSSRRHALPVWGGGARGLDRVGGRSEVVGRDMGDRRCLAGRMGGVTGRSLEVPRR